MKSRQDAGRFFLSHSSADRSTAERVLQDLESYGLDGWAAFADVEPGDAFDKAIERRLRHSDVIVVELTEAALASEHVRTELTLAREYGLEVIAFAPTREVVDALGNAEGWGYQLALKQSAAVGEWSPSVAEEIALRIHNLAAGRREDVADISLGEAGTRPRPFDEAKALADAERLREQIERIEADVYDQSPELAQTMSETLVTCLQIMVTSLRIKPQDGGAKGVSGLIDALGLGASSIPDEAFWDPWPIPELPALLQQAQGAVSNAVSVINDGRRGVSLNAHADLVGWIERTILDIPERPLASELRELDRWLQVDPKRDKNFIHIAPPRAAQHTWKISDWAEAKLPRLIRTGGFTGIIGAGATQIGASSSVMTLDSDLPNALTEVSRSSGPELTDFFGRVVCDRLDGRGRQFHTAPTEREGLHRVQFELLSIAYDATRWLIRELGREGELRPIDDWDRMGVNVGGTNLADRLENAADLLRGYTDVPGLGARAMQVRLELMAEGIREGAGARMLSGAEVEWLTDMFWHSYSFYAGTYPRMGDLALQVALVHESALGKPLSGRPRKRLEPSASIQRHDARAVDEAVASSVLRGFDEKDSGQRREFYDQLAAVAFREFRRWERSSAKDGRRPPLAMMLSTTYDLELERALAGTGLGLYHVALPVVEPIDPPKSKVQRGKLRWLLGTFGPSNSAHPKEAELRNARTWIWADDLNSSVGLTEIVGPIVVKLDGSPLHAIGAPQVPSAPGAIRGGLQARRQERSAPRPDLLHGIVLGEYDFLQYFHVELSMYARQDESKTTLPWWLFQAMRDERRTWLLLGLRLADWNSRLQLFIHAARVNPGREHFFAIQREYDEDRAALLAAIGIERVKGNLRRLTAPLRETMADLDKQPMEKMR